MLFCSIFDVLLRPWENNSPVLVFLERRKMNFSKIFPVDMDVCHAQVQSDVLYSENSAHVVL